MLPITSTMDAGNVRIKEQNEKKKQTKQNKNKNK